jgi:hypothetical protein
VVKIKKILWNKVDPANLWPRDKKKPANVWRGVLPNNAGPETLVASIRKNSNGQYSLSTQFYDNSAIKKHSTTNHPTLTLAMNSAQTLIDRTILDMLT